MCIGKYKWTEVIKNIQKKGILLDVEFSFSPDLRLNISDLEKKKKLVLGKGI